MSKLRKCNRVLNREKKWGTFPVHLVIKEKRNQFIIHHFEMKGTCLQVGMVLTLLLQCDSHS